MFVTTPSMCIFKELKFLMRLFLTLLARLFPWTKFNFGFMLSSMALSGGMLRTNMLLELSYSPSVKTGCFYYKQWFHGITFSLSL